MGYFHALFDSIKTYMHCFSAQRIITQVKKNPEEEILLLSSTVVSLTIIWDVRFRKLITTIDKTFQFVMSKEVLFIQ